MRGGGERKSRALATVYHILVVNWALLQCHHCDGCETERTLHVRRQLFTMPSHNAFARCHDRSASICKKIRFKNTLPTQCHLFFTKLPRIMSTFLFPFFYFSHKVRIKHKKCSRQCAAIMCLSDMFSFARPRIPKSQAPNKRSRIMSCHLG